MELRSSAALAGVLSLAMFGIACSSDNGDVELGVRGEGFGAGDAHIAVTRTSTNEIIACETVPVAGGTFEVDLGPIMQRNVAHRVDAFVDLDGNQRCEFGVDAIVSLELGLATDAATVRFEDGSMHVGDDPTGCASFGGFGFRVDLTGVSRSVIRYALVRLNAAGTLPDTRILTGAALAHDGTATIDVPGAGQPGRFYRIDFFEADTVDASCDETTEMYRVEPGATGADAPWECVAPGGTLGEQGDLTAGDLATGECSSFSL